MRKIARHDPKTLDKVKFHLIGSLLSARRVTLDEVPGLARAPVDEVLDRVFTFCSVVRVRVSDHRTIEIYPGGSSH